MERVTEVKHLADALTEALIIRPPRVRSSAVCTQCVAQSLPYVGLAFGGLKAMSWNARRSSGRPGDAIEASDLPSPLEETSAAETSRP